jgi:hypothetical protein
MSSLFDSIFGAYAVPAMTSQFGDEQAITLVGPDGTTLIDDGTCTLFPVEDMDQYDDSGYLKKESTIIAEVTRDIALVWAGNDYSAITSETLPDVMTSATAIIMSKTWSVNRVLSWSDNFVRLLLVDHSLKRIERRGLRRIS